MRVLRVRALIKLNRPEVGVKALLDRLIAGEPDNRVNARPGRVLEKQSTIERTRGADGREIDHGRHDPIFQLLDPQVPTA